VTCASTCACAFDSKEEAIAYCERGGIPYQLTENVSPKRQIMSYADNFSFKRATRGLTNPRRSTTDMIVPIVLQISSTIRLLIENDLRERPWAVFLFERTTFRG
jgi:hypothetical protein